MTDFNGRYILDEQGNPMPEPDLQKWAVWFENGQNRRVLSTELDSGAWVSTVFLGLDFSWIPLSQSDPLTYRPVLWETAAFEEGTLLPLARRRYTSREDALRGHWEMVEEMKKKEAAEAAELRGLVEAQSYVVDEGSITCLTCGMRSYHPTDIQEKYCGNCHKFHERTRADG